MMRRSFACSASAVALVFLVGVCLCQASFVPTRRITTISPRCGSDAIIDCRRGFQYTRRNTNAVHASQWCRPPRKEKIGFRFQSRRRDDDDAPLPRAPSPYTLLVDGLAILLAVEFGGSDEWCCFVG
jgi:hypothetical protein